MWLCAINAELCIMASIGGVFVISAFGVIRIVVGDYIGKDDE